MPALLRARAVERPRPDPQGTAVRPDRPRGQSRRRRQGVLLLSRLDADALLHEGAVQVSAGGVSLRAARRGEPPRGTSTIRSSNCRHRRRSTSNRYFDVVAEYAKASPNDMLIRITVANRGPEPATHPRAADAVVPQYLDVGLHARGLRGQDRSLEAAGTRCDVARHATLGSIPAATAIRRRRHGRPTCCSRRTKPTQQRLFDVPIDGSRYVKDAFHDYVIHRRTLRRGESGRFGTKAAAHYVLDGAGRRQTRAAAAACDGATSRRDRANRSADVRRRLRAAHRRGGRVLRRDASLPHVTGEARDVVRQAYAGLLWTQAVLPLRREGLARGRPDQPPPPASAPTAAITIGRISTTATSSRCPTNGSTRGTPRGTWRST